MTRMQRSIAVICIFFVIGCSNSSKREIPPIHVGESQLDIKWFQEQNPVRGEGPGSFIEDGNESILKQAIAIYELGIKYYVESGNVPRSKSEIADYAKSKDVFLELNKFYELKFIKISNSEIKFVFSSNIRKSDNSSFAGEIRSVFPLIKLEAEKWE